MNYSVSQLNPLRFSENFPKRLGIFNQFFTHLLYDHFYTKRDHLANFYISLEL